MPQKTWVVGEEVLAADFNTYVQNQVVPRFATVAARDAAWPAATAGAGAYSDTADSGLWRSNGTLWVAIPAGVVAIQLNTGNYQTIAPHTTYQDTGMTLTFTPVAGHRYRFTYVTNPYTPGGVQDIAYKLLAGATTVRNWEIGPLTTAVPRSFTMQHSYIPGAIGSTVFKIQVAGSVNTQIYDWANATEPRQFTIEDVGSV
jgi:hypothetical protein